MRGDHFRGWRVLAVVGASLMVSSAAPVAAWHNSPAANDDFADAIVVASLPFTGSADTEDATLQAGEPTPCGMTGATVWYSFTSAFTGFVSADTWGSSYDTVIAAHRGNSLAELVLLACDDDTEGWLSTIRFPVTIGETYDIQAGGYIDSGDLVLNLARVIPANDDLAQATPITTFPFTARQDTLGATVEESEPLDCGYMTTTVWYSFTAEGPGVVEVSTLQSTFDTSLALYEGATMGGLDLVACSDHVVSTGSSVVTLVIPQAADYSIQVGGRAGATGDLVLRVLDLAA